MLELRPIGTREACAVVKRLHRHLPRVVGGLFAASVFAGGELVGVGVASQPKAPRSRDGFTVEITRIATDGHPNACSRLYGALCRAATAVGYLPGDRLEMLRAKLGQLQEAVHVRAA